MRRTAFVLLTFFLASAAQAAEWIISPIVLWGTVAAPMTVDLRTFVKNPTNGPVKYHSTGMPSFLQLTEDGFLSGTPRAENSGLTQFRVLIDDGTGDQPAIIEMRIASSDTPVEPPAGALKCKDGNDATLVGPTPDKKYDLFACPR